MSGEMQLDVITESCDTINTEIECSPYTLMFNTDIENEHLLSIQEARCLQRIRMRIVLRQFLRSWLQNYRQQRVNQ